MLGWLGMHPALLAQNADCETTFLKRIVAPGKSSSGYKIVPASDGTFFLAASADDLTVVARADEDMNLLWSKSVDLAPGQDAITDLRFDSDGQLIGTGNASTAPVECFAFKMNPTTGQIVWRSMLNSPINSYFTRILEKNSGGNYLLFGQTDAAAGGSGCDALLMEVERNTGTRLWDKHYNLGSCEIFNDVFIEDSLIYTCGRYNLDDSGQAGFRTVATVLDLAGNVQWSKHYIHNNTSARTYSTGMLRDTGGIVVMGYSVPSGISLANARPTLMKIDNAGNGKWHWRYDLTGGTNGMTSKLLKLPDGYLIGGTFTRNNSAGQEITLIRTDKNGKHLWLKSFGINGEDRLMDMILSGDRIYLIGRQQSGATFNILVGKLNLNGEVTGTCTYVKSLNTNDLHTVPAPSFTHKLASIEVEHNYATGGSVSVVNATLVPENICFQDCPCSQPDVVWSGVAGVSCVDGRTEVRHRICNQGLEPIPAGMPVSLYDGNPLTTNAKRLATVVTTASTAPDSCQVVVFEDLAKFFPPSAKVTLYLVVNDSGLLTTPFMLDSLVKNSFPECSYADNLGSFEFAAAAPKPLDIGPDRSACVQTQLQTGPDFVRFTWQDGSTNPILTITSTGTYSLTATDVCGYASTDSVTITILPLNQRNETLEFCPGTTVSIGGVVYSQPGTVVDTLPAQGGGCDTIATYTLRYALQPTKSETLEFCLGTTVSIGGVAYSQPGTVVDTLPAQGGGCDTIATYTLTLTPLPQPSVVAIQCPASITVAAAVGANSAPVVYAAATSSTNCPCGTSSVQLQGLVSGSNFPVGTTQVCYRADDDCGSSRTCCFSVTVNATAPPAEEACDVKNTPCIKFEILGITQNPQKQRTYRMRVTNTCSNALIYTAFQLPSGIVADLPTTGSTYTAPSGRQYEVRNPNYTPTRSIRFKSVGAGIANGQSDIFEYTLPPQSEPLYIHATVRLEPQIFYETHLNVFDCPVQTTSNRPDDSASERDGSAVATQAGIAVFPNPATDVIFVQMPTVWVGQRVQLCFANAYGSVLRHETSAADGGLLQFALPTGWPAGLYHIEALNEQGERLSGRFVRLGNR